MRYVPTGIKFEYLSREFLFAVIFEVDRDHYYRLVEDHEKLKALKKQQKLADYAIKITDKYKEKLMALPDLKDYEANETHTFIKKKKRLSIQGVYYKKESVQSEKIQSAGPDVNTNVEMN
jgi:hypothetical protein